jgi:hypothetical protein
MDYSEFTTAFESFSIAHTRDAEDYDIYWYDREDNAGSIEDYRIQPSE